MGNAVIERRYALGDRLLLHVVSRDFDGVNGGIRFGNRFDA